MNGSVRVYVLFYKTYKNGRVYDKQYIKGYSEIQPLRNKNQQRQAYNNAVSNAIHKYANYKQVKYDDVESNYSVQKSWIVAEGDMIKYKRHAPKRKLKLKRDEKVLLHRQETERRIEKRKDIRDEAISRKQQQTELYGEPKVVITKKEYDRLKKKSKK